MPSIRNAFVRLQLAVLIASGTGLFGRLISIGELPLVWFRVMIGSVALALVMGWRQQLGRIQRRHLMQIMGCGVLLSVHWVFFYGSIKAANVSVGAVCFALVGFFTAVLEPFISRHRPSWQELLLGGLTVAGIALIFGFDARYRLGIAMGVVSSVLYALFSIYSKRIQSTTAESSSTMLLYEMVGGIVVLSLLLPVYATAFPDAKLWPMGRDLWLMLIFATIFTVVPFLMQLQALRHISAFTVNLTYNLEPVYTILLAALLFGEAAEVGLSFWVGVGFIALSVGIQTMRSVKH